MTQWEPAAAWPVVWTCDVLTVSPTVTGRAVAFATDVLWAKTGMRFGLTSVKLRPCRDLPIDVPWPDSWLSWPGTQRPPLGATSSGGYYGGWWFGSGCGSCTSGCTCTEIWEVKLPAPVRTITEVKVDGVVLATSAYRVDENRFLVRLDGSTWPLSNNLLEDDTLAGSWSVTAQYGEDVPASAGVAVGELACEYIRAVNGEDCRLPRSVTQLARQGVTITLPDMSEMLDRGKTGFVLADLFISTWNPDGLKARSRVYSVDQHLYRRAGT